MLSIQAYKKVSLLLFIFVLIFSLTSFTHARGFNVKSDTEDATNFSIQNVNSSEYWDGLDTPADIDTGDLTDDGTFWKSDGSSTATGNWDIGSYNFTTTGSGFFTNLGSSISRIVMGWFTDVSISNDLNVTGNVNVTGNLTADYINNIDFKNVTVDGTEITWEIII